MGKSITTERLWTCFCTVQTIFNIRKQSWLISADQSRRETPVTQYPVEDRTRQCLRESQIRHQQPTGPFKYLKRKSLITRWKSNQPVLGHYREWLHNPEHRSRVLAQPFRHSFRSSGLRPYNVIFRFFTQVNFDSPRTWSDASRHRSGCLTKPARITVRGRARTIRALSLHMAFSRESLSPSTPFRVVRNLQLSREKKIGEYRLNKDLVSLVRNTPKKKRLPPHH